MHWLIGKLLNLDLEDEGTLQGWSIHWTNMSTPQQILLFLLAAAACVAIVWWFYKREPEYCPRKRKLWLASFRAAGLFVLLAILAGPVLMISYTKPVRSKVVMLIDASRSMSNKDKYANDTDKLTAAHTLGLIPPKETNSARLSNTDLEKINGTSRLDMVRAWLSNKDLAFLENLQKDYDVEMWRFALKRDRDYGLTLIGPDGSAAGPSKVDASLLENVVADGPATDIGGALRDLSEKLKNQVVSGVVLVSDGGNNTGENPAAVAGDLPLRIFPVGIGVPEATDVAVNYVIMENKLFLDDLAPIYVRIKNRGYADRQVDLVVSSNGEELQRQSITLKRSGEQAEVIRVKPKKPGTQTFKIELPALEGDQEPGNNVKEKEITVIDKKIRVLVLESEPRWEYRFMKNALLRDKRLETKILIRVPKLAEIADKSSPYIKEFPKREELFKYDVIVFGNMPNDSFWTEQDLENIKKFVRDEGGGIWFIAGKNNFPDAYHDSKNLEMLIPVKFDVNPPLSVEEEQQHPITEGWRLQLTPEGRTHNLLRLEPTTQNFDEDNAALWEHMPDLFWFHHATEAKPGATVLAVQGAGKNGAPVTGKPPPIVVVSMVGRGRVFYSAIEQFWRMRQPPEMGPEALERFYGHAVQYLGLAHALGGSARIQINTDKDEYFNGDTVKVTAHVLQKSTYELSAEPKQDAVLINLENDQVVSNFELFLDPKEKGMYNADLPAKDVGHFRVMLKSDEDEKDRAYKDYFVRPSQVEADPDLKVELLDDIAKESVKNSKAAAAKMYFPDKAGEIIDELKKAQRDPEIHTGEHALWNTPLMALLFTLFMGAEWLMRKRSDLC